MCLSVLLNPAIKYDSDSTFFSTGRLHFFPMWTDRQVLLWILWILGGMTILTIILSSIGGVIHQNSGSPLREWCTRDHFTLNLEMESAKEMKAIQKRWTTEMAEVAFANQASAFKVIEARLYAVQAALRGIANVAYIFSDVVLSVSARRFHCYFHLGP